MSGLGQQHIHLAMMKAVFTKIESQIFTGRLPLHLVFIDLKVNPSWNLETLDAPILEIGPYGVNR